MISSSTNTSDIPSDEDWWTAAAVCEDCQQVTEGDGFHYDNTNGCHEVCLKCGERRGFRENQALR